MARNGAGIYSPPAASFPAVADTLIDATKFNAIINDMVTALTLSMATDGQSTVTANIPMSGFKFTGLGTGSANGHSLIYEQLFNQGIMTDIASASTVDIGGQNTNFLNVTGTTTITSLGTNYKGPRFLIFSGILTLTHNSSTLNLPSGGNITTAAGDSCIAIPHATAGVTDGWKIISYQRATGYSVLPVIVKDYISGLTLSPAGSSSSMPISAGHAADGTNTVMYSLSSAISKTTSSWAVGSGNGGLDEGTITNNNWYRWYLIQRPDTGVVDVSCSLSNGNSGNVTISIASPAVVTWDNHGHVAGAGIVFSTTGALPTGLVAGTRYYIISTGLASGSFQLSATIGGAAINTSGSQSGTHSVTTPPALPANYTYYREIGSGLTDGAAQWTKIIQDGDFFQYDVIPTMGTTTNQGTSALVEAAIVPKGKRIKALLNIMLINGATPTGILVSDLSISDGAVATNASPLPQIVCGVANQPSSGQIEVMVNTNGNFRTRLTFSDASTIVRLCTAGWYDYRGKN